MMDDNLVHRIALLADECIKAAWGEPLQIVLVGCPSFDDCRRLADDYARWMLLQPINVVQYSILSRGSGPSYDALRREDPSLSLTERPLIDSAVSWCSEEIRDAPPSFWRVYVTHSPELWDRYWSTFSPRAGSVLVDVLNGLFTRQGLPYWLDRTSLACADRKELWVSCLCDWMCNESDDPWRARRLFFDDNLVYDNGFHLGLPHDPAEWQRYLDDEKEGYVELPKEWRKLSQQYAKGTPDEWFAELPDLIGASGAFLRSLAETVSAEAKRTDRDNSKSIDPKHQRILEALETAGADCPEKRITAAAIAVSVGDGLSTADDVKHELAELKRLDYVDSKKGRSGGTWLLDKGKKQCAKGNTV